MTRQYHKRGKVLENKIANREEHIKRLTAEKKALIKKLKAVQTKCKGLVREVEKIISESEQADKSRDVMKELVEETERLGLYDAELKCELCQDAGFIEGDTGMITCPNGCGR